MVKNLSSADGRKAQAHEIHWRMPCKTLAWNVLSRDVAFFETWLPTQWNPGWDPTGIQV